MGCLWGSQCPTEHPWGAMGGLWGSQRPTEHPWEGIGGYGAVSAPWNTPGGGEWGGYGVVKGHNGAVIGCNGAR